MHSGMNNSNHSAIFTKLKVGELNIEVESIKSEKRVNWAKASDIARENYRFNLSGKLNTLASPDCLNCHDLNCNEHNLSIEDYTMDVLQAVESTAKECLPSTGGGSGVAKPRTTGWTEYVKPYCEESKFWSRVWVSSGKP